jgi:hypothetical protein
VFCFSQPLIRGAGASEHNENRLSVQQAAARATLSGWLDKLVSTSSVK